MGRRRGSGEGSIYHAKDGRWRGEISLGYKPDGRPRRKILYARTRSELASEMTRVLREVQIGHNVAPGKQTIEQLLTQWLEQIIRKNRKPDTYRSYEWIVRVHLIPHLGKMQVDKLTPQQVQTFLNERHDSGLNAGTVRHINATLRAALSRAQKWQLVHLNVAKLVTLPQGKKYKPTVLSPDQAKRLLKATEDHKYSALFVVALSLGLRRGEVIGLKWSDINLGRGELRVSGALGRVKGIGLQMGEPKSNSSKRTLMLPKMCLAALERQRVLQEEQRRWSGSKWKEDDYVFTSTDGGPILPETVTREFAEALNTAKLPAMRFQDLRHSCATLLLVQGVHPKLVQATLGHSSFQLTMDTYSHILPALKNEVASRMDDIFSTPTKTPTKTRPTMRGLRSK